MKATLAKATTSRSLQRRWELNDAEPVRSFLPPYTEFVPADLRIWWGAETGKPVNDHRLHVYAWPAERDSRFSASWDDGYNHHPLPDWVRELSDVVHEDLIDNAASSNTGAEDLWAYTADRTWTLEDAAPVTSFHAPHESFIPAGLNVWNSFNAGQARQNRHKVHAYPGDRNQRLRLSADWGGGVDWDARPRYDQAMPEWIREMVEEQHEQLVAFATQSEQGRRIR